MFVFDALVAAHVVTGTTGLASVWVPILARKGSVNHKFWGRVFVGSMLATGTFAVGLSLCSLTWPLETHPFSDDAALVRGMFGWMMLYLGILTIALAWHSYVTVRHKTDRALYGRGLNVAIQAAMGLSALNCAVQGVLINQYLMVGVAVPGLAAAFLNSAYLRDRNPLRQEWLVQHFRSGIGTGISVYTAFFAFGAVNAVPSLAFNPVLWALPTVLGVGYMIHYQLQVTRQRFRLGCGDEMRVGRYLARWLAPGAAAAVPANRRQPAMDATRETKTQLAGE